MMDNNIIYVPKMNSLDSMDMEAVCEEMRSNAPKHGIDCVNWKESFPYHPITIFSVAYSDKYLYVCYSVSCNYLRAVNYKNNTNVCEDSCVEFFMQLPESEEYWNFEFNCIGTVNSSHRKEKKYPTRLTDEEISSIRRYASCGDRPFQELEGLFDWNLVIAIPFDLVGWNIEKTKQIKGNFYKCASATSMPHYLSWAPIATEKPNFHCREFFGDIVLK